MDPSFLSFIAFFIHSQVSDFSKLFKVDNVRNSKWQFLARLHFVQGRASGQPADAAARPSRESIRVRRPVEFWCDWSWSLVDMDRCR
jgi:hypothetical protein